jgi:predicted metal-binding membrane protein
MEQPLVQLIQSVCKGGFLTPPTNRFAPTASLVADVLSVTAFLTAITVETKTNAMTLAFVQRIARSSCPPAASVMRMGRASLARMRETGPVFGASPRDVVLVIPPMAALLFLLAVPRTPLPSLLVLFVQTYSRVKVVCTFQGNMNKWSLFSSCSSVF